MWAIIVCGMAGIFTCKFFNKKHLKVACIASTTLFITLIVWLYLLYIAQLLLNGWRAENLSLMLGQQVFDSFANATQTLFFSGASCQTDLMFIMAAIGLSGLGIIAAFQAAEDIAGFIYGIKGTAKIRLKIYKAHFRRAEPLQYCIQKRYLRFCRLNN